MILPPLTWVFYSFMSSQTVYVLQSVYDKPMEVYICSWFIILLLQICTSQTFCQRHNRPSKKKIKNDCYISWTYLSELLMLHIKLSLLDVGVHAPKRSRDTLHLERRNLTSSWRRKKLRKKKKSLFFKGFLFSLCPLTTSPFSHFRPPAARTHLSARSRTL